MIFPIHHLRATYLCDGCFKDPLFLPRLGHLLVCNWLDPDPSSWGKLWIWSRQNDNDRCASDLQHLIFIYILYLDNQDLVQVFLNQAKIFPYMTSPTSSTTQIIRPSRTTRTLRHSGPVIFKICKRSNACVAGVFETWVGIYDWG